MKYRKIQNRDKLRGTDQVTSTMTADIQDQYVNEVEPKIYGGGFVPIKELSPSAIGVRFDLSIYKDNFIGRRPLSS